MSLEKAIDDALIEAPTERAAERRQHILDAARHLFIENGFHRTGVAQIAAASGVKVGQLYRDFSCKEDIIVAIVFRDLSQFLDEPGLERAIALNDMETIRRWMLNFISFDKDIDGYRLMPEIMAETARNPRIARLQGEINDRLRQVLDRALAAWAPGESRAAARGELADLILALGGGLCHTVIAAAQKGSDYRPLCCRLQDIVNRELDAIRAS